MALALDAYESLPELIVRNTVRNIRADLLRQRYIGNADLLALQRRGIGYAFERTGCEHLQVGRHVNESSRFRVDPDAEHPLLAARHRGFARARHGHNNIVAAVVRRRRLIAL